MKEEIEHCEELIKKWNSTPYGPIKDKIRNDLFIIIQPSICKWISSILSKKGQYTSPEEVKSQSWDCFEYCLKHFKPERPIPIPNHFYAYTKFKLLTLKPKKMDKALRESRPAENGDDTPDDLFLVYGHLEELKVFRSLLPEEYASVFDDAIMSMVPDNRQWIQRIDKSKISYVKYQEVKRIFKIVVEYLIMR